MSPLKQEALPRGRRFEEEFKRSAVRLVVEEGYTFKGAAPTMSRGATPAGSPGQACPPTATAPSMPATTTSGRQDLVR